MAAVQRRCFFQNPQRQEKKPRGTELTATAVSSWHSISHSTSRYSAHRAFVHSLTAVRACPAGVSSLRSLTFPISLPWRRRVTKTLCNAWAAAIDVLTCCCEDEEVPAFFPLLPTPRLVCKSSIKSTIPFRSPPADEEAVSSSCFSSCVIFAAAEVVVGILEDEEEEDDPVLALPWEEELLEADEPAVLAFFDDILLAWMVLRLGRGQSANLDDVEVVARLDHAGHPYAAAVLLLSFSQGCPPHSTATRLRLHHQRTQKGQQSSRYARPYVSQTSHHRLTPHSTGYPPRSLVAVALAS